MSDIRSTTISESSSGRKRRVAELICAFLFFFVCACAFTWPAIVELEGHTIGDPMRTTVRQEYFHQWNFLHRAEQSDALHYFRTDLLNHPYGQDISENMGISLNLFAYLPLTWVDDVFARANLLVIFFLTLNGFFMFLLIKKMTRDYWISLACGLVFFLNPLVFLKLSQGFHQKIILFWMPLFWMAVLDMRSRGKLSDGLLAGLWLALMLFSYAQYAYFSLILFGLFFIVTSLRPLVNPAPPLRSILPFAFGLGSAVLLFFWVVHDTEPVFGQVWRKPFDENYFMVGVFDIANPFRFFPYRHHWFYNVPFSFGLTILLPFLTIAGLVLAKTKKLPKFYLFGAGVFLLIAMGGYLFVGDHFVTVAGQKIPLLYKVLLLHVPYGYRLGFPIRAFAVVFFCLTIFGAFSLMAIGRRLRIPSIALALVVIVLCIGENRMLLPEIYPPRVEKADIPALYKQIRHEPGKAVLNVPLVRIESDYIYFSTLAKKSQVNLYLTPRRKGVESLVLDFPRMADSEEDKRKFVCRLAKSSVFHVVVHPPFIEEGLRKGQEFSNKTEKFLKRPAITSLEETVWMDALLGGPEIFDNGRFLLYRIPSQPSFCEALPN